MKHWQFVVYGAWVTLVVGACVWGVAKQDRYQNDVHRMILKLETCK